MFDGYVAHRFFRSVALRISLLSFSHSRKLQYAGMACWLAAGNRVDSALARIKSYLDYGTFTPIQVAAIAALEGDEMCS